jgi:hypothetical protein
MKSNSNYLGAAGKLLKLLPILLFLGQFAARGAVEETFDVLKTKTATYTNVTVTKKTKDWIFILHAQGMINIRIQDLPAEVLEKLGYGKNSQKSDSAQPAFSAKKIFENVHLPQMKPLEEALQKNGSAQLSKITGNKTWLLISVGILAGIYLFFANCCRLICRKTHNAAGFLVWVPLLQLIPLFRAANMSRMWFLAFLIPALPLPFLHSIKPTYILLVALAVMVVPVIAQVIWSVKIVKARGKNGWVSLFLLLPVTSFFSFLYLAFSSDAPVVIKQEYKSMALETA